MDRQDDRPMNSTGVANNLKMLAFTTALGAFAGAVLWCFLKAVAAAEGFFSNYLPARLNTPLVSIVIIIAAGALLGYLHQRFGNYPDELFVVMGRVKKQGHYDYHPMFVMLVCAFLPLVFGASVGPEAGLAGIITALCYWVGDNVTYAKKHEREYSMIGEAVTLGQLFHSPLFGIFAVEESVISNRGEDENGQKSLLPRAERLLYYGISTAASFLIIGLLNHLFGKAMTGFPRFEEFAAGPKDYAMMLVYIPVGILLWLWFAFSERITEKAAEVVPVIIREVIGAAAIAVIGLVLPVVLFSGEEELAVLMESYGRYLPTFLLIVGILKILMTAFCLNFGWKGGHFFPLIFACSCVGFGIAMLVFPDPAGHVVFAAGVVTASALGAQLRKPLAVAALLLLCFPVRTVFWIFLAALLAGLFRGKLLGRMK